MINNLLQNKKNVRLLSAGVMLGTGASLLGLSSCQVKENPYSRYTEKDLVWEENFDGDSLNTDDWNFEFHEKGWVNHELQSYDDSSANTYVKDGCLVIQALKSRNDDGTVSYTSGRINTQHKHFFKYGRIEARIKVPEGKGFLPAFWMMPEEESFYGQWPKCGETDIMEVLGNKTDTAYSTLHFGEPHTQKQGSYTLTKGTFADSFHVFTVDWEPDEMRFYVDGNLFKTINDWFTKREGFDEVTFPAPYDQNFYIILNLAVGGDWPGNPDSSTTFDEKAQMQVDWVKVYQKPSYNENVTKKTENLDTAEQKGNIAPVGKDAWIFLTAGNGKGSYEADKTSVDIYSEYAGNLEYSVQLVSKGFALVKGTKYRYSFDASADEDRTAITGITGPDNGYTRYFGDKKINLSKTPRHFEFDFDMNANTDSNCRIEYNLGAQGSIARVHIENVKLEAIGTFNEEDKAKSVLPDGNFVYNGQFDEGKDRLLWWTVEDKEKTSGYRVTNENLVRQFAASVDNNESKADSLCLIQKGLAVPEDIPLVLSFDLSAENGGTVYAEIGSFKAFVKPQKEMKHYELPFVINDTVSSRDLTFSLGEARGALRLDNVSIKEDALLKNGTFFMDMTGWEVYAADEAKTSHEIIQDDEGKAFCIDIKDTGSQDWMIQLKQNDVLLEEGKTYTLSFRAKSDTERTIMYALQRDGSSDNDWTPYSGNPRIELSPALKEYSVTFTMKYPTDARTILSISMGAVDKSRIRTAHKVYIKDVRLTSRD